MWPRKGTSNHRHPDDGHQDDVSQGDEDKGDGLAQHQFEGPDGGHQDLLHGADLLFPHHRQGREHQGEQQHHHGDDPGHHGVAGNQVGVEPGPGLEPQGRAQFPGPGRAPALEAGLELLLGIVSDDRAGVAADDEGGVGVGGVHDDLDFAGFSLPELLGEIPLDPDGHGDLAAVDEVYQLFLIMEVIFYVEPVGGTEALEEIAALHGAAFIQNGRGHVLDVEVDHVAVSEELHQGRHDEKKAQLPVSPDLDEFLEHDMSDASEHSSQLSAFSWSVVSFYSFRF